jgi:hypothetical protein
MAETTILTVAKDAIIQLSSGDASPKTYTVKIHSGSATLAAGGKTIVRAMDTDGTYVGIARDGGQAGVSTIQIEAMVYDVGANTTEAVFMDFVKQGGTGYVNTSWASAESGGGADFLAYNVKIIIADVGAKKGATYLLNDCIVQPGAQISMARDGFKVSMTLESPDSFPTITRNA